MKKALSIIGKIILGYVGLDVLALVGIGVSNIAEAMVNRYPYESILDIDARVCDEAADRFKMFFKAAKKRNIDYTGKIEEEI